MWKQKLIYTAPLFLSPGHVISTLPLAYHDTISIYASRIDRYV